MRTASKILLYFCMGNSMGSLICSCIRPEFRHDYAISAIIFLGVCLTILLPQKTVVRRG